MAANWTVFEQKLTTYLSLNISQSTRDTAEKIVQLYEEAIVGAKDLIAHQSLVLNQAKTTILINSIEAGFNSASMSPTAAGAKLALENAINSSIVIYWTGALLTTLYNGSPPGFISFTPPNVITVPGVCTFVLPPQSNNYSSLPAALSLAFRSHLLTLNGLITLAVLPTPATPVPLPWVGMI